MIFSSKEAQILRHILILWLNDGKKSCGGFQGRCCDLIVLLRHKNLRNASYSCLCAVSRATLSELLAGPNLELVNTTVKEIMGEIILVAQTSGAYTGTLLEDEAVDIMRRTKPVDYKPSILVDLEANRPMEVEVILGEIVRKAAEVGVPVPR